MEQETDFSVLVVCGSRSINDLETVKQEIEKGLEKFNETEESIDKLLTGGAKGVDDCASTWVGDKEIISDSIEPEWDKYNPKRAPIERNKELISRADYVIAIWDGESSGTKFMIDTVEKTDVPLYVKVCGTKTLDSF